MNRKDYKPQIHRFGDPKPSRFKPAYFFIPTIVLMAGIVMFCSKQSNPSIADTWVHQPNSAEVYPAISTSNPDGITPYPANQVETYCKAGESVLPEKEENEAFIRLKNGAIRYYKVDGFGNEVMSNPILNSGEITLNEVGR